MEIKETILLIAIITIVALLLAVVLAVVMVVLFRHSELENRKYEAKEMRERMGYYDEDYLEMENDEYNYGHNVGNYHSDGE